MTVVNLPAKTARRLRAALIFGGVVAALGAADSGIAIHAEHVVAQHVQENSRLETAPNVFIGGLPYTQAFITQEIPHMAVNALDVEVPEFGMVNASTVLRDVTVTPQQALSGDLDDAPVSLLSRSISIDGVSLGRVLGITDLSIANPDDISPAGGITTEAELTGTAPGTKEKSTVLVTLRLHGPRFDMTPVKVVSAPTDSPLSEEELKEAFSYSMDTRRLPLPNQATSVRMTNGAITFDVQRHNVKLAMSSLSPLEEEGELGEQFKPKQDPNPFSSVNKDKGSEDSDEKNSAQDAAGSADLNR